MTLEASQDECTTILPAVKVEWGTVEADIEITTGTKRFRMVPAYSGGLLDLPDWDVPVVIDLQGLDCSDQQRPILLRHKKDENSIVGHSEQITNDGRQVTILGVIHAEEEAGASILRRAKVKYPWEASVGVLIHKSRRIHAGETCTANGRQFTGPLELVEKSRMRETSFCVIGCDAENHVEIEAAGTYDESKHSRANDGKFASKGGGGGSGSSKSSGKSGSSKSSSSGKGSGAGKSFSDRPAKSGGTLRHIDNVKGYQKDAADAVWHFRRQEDPSLPEKPAAVVVSSWGFVRALTEKDARGEIEGGSSPKSKPKQRAVKASAEGEAIMDKTFEEWLASIGMDVSVMSEQQVSELRKAFDAMQGGATAEAEGDEANTPVEEEEGKPKEGQAAAKKRGGGKRSVEAAGDRGEMTRRRREAADEIERVVAIGTICRGNRTLEAEAIREGFTLDQTRLRVLEASAPTWASSRGTGDGSWDNRAQVLEAAICRLAGVRDASMERQFQPRVLEAADRGDVRGITLGQLFGEFVNAHGGHVRPGRLSRDDLQHVSQINHRMVEAAGGFSTVSLPGILSNAANKILLDAYASVVSVVPDITAPQTTSDFKEFTAYRLTGKGELAEVGPTGELKDISLQEEDYKNRVRIHGGIITLTEEMMTNDDLGAFAAATSVLGHMAMDDLQLAVVKLKLANTGNFYHADNKNLLTGAPSALGISGLDDAITAFLEQKDKNNRGIMLPPKQLVVPAKLKGLGDRLYTGTTLNETTTTDKSKPNSNNHVGLYKVITVPYFGTNFNAINGNAGSDTKWWLEAAPMIGAAPIYVAYLNGQKTPRIEQGQAPFNVLGTQFRVVFPWGVGYGDKRTSVQNNGV